MFVVPPPNSSAPPPDTNEAFVAVLTLVVICFLVYALGRVKLPSFKKFFTYIHFLLRKKESAAPQQAEEDLV
ncbi:MAG: hypothetical protein BGO43_08530 [Gammaproteobacteria bacterium 39-13]|nr:MAG: hypothetical protein BGO43_08530 [Gammaproteobacteria bacterium 39-13]